MVEIEALLLHSFLPVVIFDRTLPCLRTSASRFLDILSFFLAVTAHVYMYYVEQKAIVGASLMKMKVCWFQQQAAGITRAKKSTVRLLSKRHAARNQG